MDSFRIDKYGYLLLLVALLCGCSRKQGPVHPEEPDDQRTKYGLKATTTLWGMITDQDKKPLQGISVSDGFTVTQTDNRGIYELVRHERARFVYYTTPAIFRLEVDTDNHPSFYARIRNDQALARQDFSLTRINKEEKWTLICVGDPQTTTQDDVQRFVNETVADIDRTAATLQQSGQSVYAITLGDIVHDVPAVYPLMRSAMSRRRVSFHQVLGNHDHTENMSDLRAHEVYENTFGPRNYSFERGDAHIIALDNYINLNNLDGKPTGGLTDETWEGLQADLAVVPKDRMIILCAHVPFRQGTASTHGRDVVNLLKTFKEAHIMTGHTHTNEKWKHDGQAMSQLMEHTHGTACGAHWRSRVCLDGTPNGYAVYSVAKNHVNDYYYKATGEQYDRNYQMRLYDGATRFYNSNSHYYFNSYFGEAENRVVANIWNADPTWIITLEEEGYAPVEMMQAQQPISDLSAYTYHLFYKNKEWTGETNHYWQALLPSGKKPQEATFTVRAKDVRNNFTYTKYSSPANPGWQIAYEGIGYP
jgi:hypothetical protein